MSNRFHNKFHRHNHHTKPTDGTGLYPDSAHDPIASPDAPFQGEFCVDGNITSLSSVSSVDGTFERNVVVKNNLNVGGNVVFANTQIANSDTVLVRGNNSTVAVRQINPVIWNTDAVFMTSVQLALKLDKPSNPTPSQVLTFDGSYWVAANPNAVPDVSFSGAVSSIGNTTIYSGIVPATKGGAGGVPAGLLKTDGNGLVSKALSGVDYVTVNSVNTKITNPSAPTTLDGCVLTYVASSSSWEASLPAVQLFTGVVGYDGTTTTYLSVVPSNRGGAGDINGILMADGNGNVTAAAEGSDYVSSGGLGAVLASYAHLSSLATVASYANLATKIDKPGSASNGQILKYNGTAWVAGNTDSSSVVKYLPLSGGNVTGSLTAANVTVTETLTANTVNVTNLNVSGPISFSNILETAASVSITSNAATIDVSSASLFRLSLTDTVQITFINPPVTSKIGSFLLQTIGADQSIAIRWPTSVIWSGVAPSVSLVVNTVDTYSFLTIDAGATWYGFTVSQGHKI